MSAPKPEKVPPRKPAGPADRFNDSWYRASAKAFPRQPRLKGAARADVGIVGGGFTGLSAAIELARAGFDVTLLEAEDIGYGCSGRSGGQIGTEFSCGIEKVEKLVGREIAELAFQVGEDAKSLIRERVDTYGIECELKLGYLHPITRARSWPDLEHEKKVWESYGYDGVKLLDKATLEERLGSEIYHGALWEPAGGHLHPLSFTRGLAEAARKEGAHIHEQSPVTAIGRGTGKGGENVLTTPSGELHCKYVILAGNAYLGKLVPETHRKIMPVGSYILATEPLGEARARELIRDDDAVADTNNIVDYYRLSGDRRMLFGGRASYSTLAPKDLFAFMRPRMLRVFPQLADAKLDYCWGGNVGITMNRMIDVGRIGKTIYFAHGYSGHGVALSGMCGKLMADAIQGQAGRFDALAKIPHTPFPGGPVRTPLLMLAMLYYRLRDLVG